MISIRMKPLAKLLLIPSLCFTAVANANDPLALNPASAWYGLNAEPGWQFDFELGLEYEPTYAGSDEYVSEGDIGARALYRTESGHRYFVSFGELGAAFSLSPNTQFLAFLEYEDERNDDDDSTLTGMDIIDSTIEGQFMLATRFGNATLFGVLQPDLTGDANKGVVWFVGAGYDWLSADNNWRASTTLDISGADAEYMRTEFGVTVDESTRTGYSIYQPSSGFKSLSWNMSTEYYFTKNFSLLSSVDTEFYMNEASDSPLIHNEGRDLTFEASVQLRYKY